MVERQYPLPPIHEMRHGSVWQVTLEAPRQMLAAKTLKAAVEGAPRSREHLVLVAGFDGVPHRSRLLVGDLSRRTQEAILCDLQAIMRQHPPVRRNWRRNMLRGAYGGINWHLMWCREVAFAG